jgi:cob(I)alamin adenosyltransferase
VELSQKENVNPNILKYMNRLSDFLFVVARFENKKDGDILWIPNKKV